MMKVQDNPTTWEKFLEYTVVDRWHIFLPALLVLSVGLGAYSGTMAWFGWTALVFSLGVMFADKPTRFKLFFSVCLPMFVLGGLMVLGYLGRVILSSIF